MTTWHGYPIMCLRHNRIKIGFPSICPGYQTQLGTRNGAYLLGFPNITFAGNRRLLDKSRTPLYVPYNLTRSLLSVLRPPLSVFT
eukprot:1188703-Prorocentrum_minimum.AAC.5